MAKTAKPGLLLVVLAGVVAGLWLAARTGEDLGLGSEETSSGGVHPRGADGVASDDETFVASELADPSQSGRERPRPDPSDARLVPKAGETCLSAAVEAHDGSVPAGARIALFALDDGRPVFPPAAVFSPDGDGLVRACARIEHEMDAVAFAPGCRLTSRRVHPAADARIDLEPLVLERGGSVRGRVTAGGAPLARAEVEARAIAPGYEARVDGGRIGWRAGRYVWCATRAVTDENGAYEIAGLEPGEHTMHLFAVRQRAAAIDVQKVPLVRASVPGGVADFALPAARLDLSFEAAGAPLCCVEVQIAAGERQFTRQTDDYGHIAFMIQPELAYDLIAGRNGFTTKRTQLRGLTDGEHRPEKIALEPQTELATLIVDDGGSADTFRATFEFRPRFSSGQKDAVLERKVQRGAGSTQFLVKNVPVGSWRVTMRSGSNLSASLLSNCEQDFLVDVPESGVVEAKVSVTKRASLLVTTRLDGGSSVTPTVQLLTPDGSPIEGVTVEPVDSSAGQPATNGAPAPRSTMMVRSSWCAGAVDVRVSAEGRKTATVRASLIAGQTTPVDVVLHSQ